MIAAWMLYCTGIALAFVVVGYALERGLHLAGRPTRWAWVVALAGSFVIPAAAWLRPEAFSALSVPLAGPAILEPLTLTAPMVTGAPGAAPAPAAAFSLSDLDGALAWGWGLSSAALLSVFGAAALRLAALRRRWRASLVDGRAVLVSENVGPAVAGLWRQEVIVPGWALALGEPQRQLMLSHEEEHVRAADPWLLACGAAGLVLMPWNPVLWWQVRRLRLAVEIDCDARVLALGGTPPEYGELLLQVGRRRARLPLAAPALGEPASFLERRIRRMATVLPRWRWAGAAVALTIAVGAVVGACEAPRPVAGDTLQARMPDQVLVPRTGVSSADVRPLVARYFGPDPARLADSSVIVWFVVDQRGAVAASGTLARRPGDTEVDAFTAARRIPGYDTLAARVVLLHAERNLPPTIVVRLGDGRVRDLSAFDEHPEMLVLPWVRDGITRHYPALLRERSGPPVELWFVADPRKQVFRTVQRPGQDFTRVGMEEIHAVLPGLDDSNVNSWSVIQGRGLGRLVRENVRVIWIQLREGKSIPAQ